MHDVNSFYGLGTDASQTVQYRQSFSTLFEIVTCRAARTPSQVAFRFVKDNEHGGETSLTYAELDARHAASPHGFSKQVLPGSGSYWLPGPVSILSRLSTAACMRELWRFRPIQPTRFDCIARYLGCGP